MKKLNIIHEPSKLKIVVPQPADKYKNPKGTWEVTTEGDCEGRSVKNLGVWFGHVAEIAFYLAHLSYYSLQFKSLAGTRTAGKKVPTPIETKNKNVWVSFNIESKTWDMSSEDRAIWMADFLDCKEDLDVVASYGGCVYYASSCLVLR